MTEDRLSALFLMKINQARLEKLRTRSNMAKLVQRFYQLHPRRMKLEFCYQTDENSIVIFILYALVYVLANLYVTHNLYIIYHRFWALGTKCMYTFVLSC